jgi:hypothetical protein
MFDRNFWLKYILRVFKIVALVLVSIQVINGWLTGKMNKKYEIVFFAAGFVTIIVGKCYDMQVLLIRFF